MNGLQKGAKGIFRALFIRPAMVYYFEQTDSVSLL